ncbi:MAG: hypothetical protein IJY25_00375 [Bacilli bacterium]|nr:hypothetical protein [Bacilli bacterium]
MNNSDIDLIRKKYNSLILEKKRIENAKVRILELEKDPMVKEYLSLVKIVGNLTEEKSEKQTFDIINKIVCYTKDSNKLLFDYGYISVFTLDYDESTCIHVYRDLETTEYYIEMIENEIEPMPVEWRIGNSTIEYESRKKYNTLRNYFIEQIMNRPQEEVVEEFLHNNKQLVKLK